MKEEKYHLKNLNTGLYFRGFSKEVRNKPIWVEFSQATVYEELEALRLQRRLENQYSPWQKIIMEERV